MTHHPDFLLFVIQAGQIGILAKASTSRPRLFPVQFDCGDSSEVTAVPVQVPPRGTRQSDVLNLNVGFIRRSREHLVEELAGPVGGEGEADTAGPPVAPGGAAEAGRARGLDQRACGEDIQPADVGGAGEQHTAEEEYRGRQRERRGHPADSHGGQLLVASERGPTLAELLLCGMRCMNLCLHCANEAAMFTHAEVLKCSLC